MEKLTIKKERSSIFEFNHISNDLSQQEIIAIKEFYKHHKKFWCLKKSYKRFKRLDETITILLCLMIIGTIT